MNEAVWQDAREESIDVDFSFSPGEGPTWGDLSSLAGPQEDEEDFPRSPLRYDTSALASFGFEQIDDYVGIRGNDEEGDDVVLWLYPCAGGHVVDHHPGPYDALRLSFCVLRNPAKKANLFLEAIAALSQAFRTRAFYRLRGVHLGPQDLTLLQGDIEAIIGYWRNQGIEPGSSAALRVGD